MGGVRSLDDRVLRFLRRVTRTDRLPRAHGLAATIARRPVLLVLAAMVVLAVAGARHAVVYPRLQEARVADDAAAAEQSVAPVDASGGAIVVGPTIGDPLNDHVAARQAALAALPPDATRAAVVSFTGLTPSGEAEQLLAQAGVRPAFAQLVLPDRPRPRQTEVVRGDLDASVARVVVGELERVEADLLAVEQALADPDLTDDAFRADYAARVNELQGVRRQLDTDARVVFAVVVEADAEALRAAAATPGVRLVDVAAEGVAPDAATFYGLLPSDTTVATFGAAA